MNSPRPRLRDSCCDGNEGGTGCTCKEDALKPKCCSCGERPAELDHTCPYKDEIAGDTMSMCNCCPTCMHECGMDI